MSVEVVASYERNQKKYVVLEIDNTDINSYSLSFAHHISNRNFIESRYITNKFEKKGKIEEGWIVAFGIEITETDISKAIVAAGLSIFTSNPVVIYAWMEELVTESIGKMPNRIRDNFSSEAKDEAIKFAIEIIRELIKGKGAGELLKKIGNINFKAGVGEYIGENQVKAFGGGWNIISETHFWQPYIGIKI